MAILTVALARRFWQLHVTPVAHLLVPPQFLFATQKWPQDGQAQLFSLRFERGGRTMLMHLVLPGEAMRMSETIEGA